MKDYKRHILWLDYFNSGTSRGEGRRVSIDRAVKDPSLAELTESARRLGLDPDSSSAKHPERVHLQSGYVSVAKRPNEKKQQVIAEIAKSLSTMRGEKSVAAASLEQQKKGQKQHGQKSRSR